MPQENKLHSKYGPGGRNCPCCGPNPSARKVHDRMVKRRVRMKAKKDIAARLADVHQDKE